MRNTFDEWAVEEFAELAMLLRDNCEVCHGVNGGKSGNENVVNGKRMCDYCHAKLRKENGQDQGGGAKTGQ